jgi:exonuclease VII small subunit
METQPGSASKQKPGLGQRLKQDGKQTLEQRKRSAADHINDIAQALERAASQLDDPLASYANRAALGVGNLATRLREGSIDDLLEDTRRLARRNPALFLAGGVAIGFALSRFIKASGQRVNLDDEYPTRAPTLTDEVDELQRAADIAAARQAAAEQARGL